MIILFDKDETSFTTLGLGVLKDAIECSVTEEINGNFELEMTYPITGSHYKDITLKRIIYAKPNSNDSEQPFRIYSISKPFDGKVVINAEHISYDTLGYIVKAFSGTDFGDTLTKINENSFPNCPFSLINNPDNIRIINTTMELTKPTNLRTLLFGESGSLLDIYDGEYYFDKFNICLKKNRGINRGLKIRYGKNLTDIDFDESSEKMYTGIFPFFSATISNTTTKNVKYYQKVYIVDDSIPYGSGWLSLTETGTVFAPLIEHIPVKIATDGDYVDKIIYYKKTATDINSYDAYICSGAEEYSSSWLSLTDGGDPLTPETRTKYVVDLVTYIWDETANDGTGEYIPYTSGIFDSHENVYINPAGTAYTENWFLSIDEPVTRRVYTVMTEDTEYTGLTYIWNGSSYVLYSGTGFYYTYAESGENDPDMPLTKVEVETTSSEVYVDLVDSDDYSDGIINFEGYDDYLPKKILSVDLSDKFSEEPTVEELQTEAETYITDYETELTTPKETLTISFIKLSDSDEYSQLKSLEIVNLGDYINVIYTDLDVDTTLEVISTTYNVILDKLEEIELGDKAESVINTTVSVGDSVSSLNNDAEYTSKVNVEEIIATNVSADYISSKQAKLTEAQIEQLTTDSLLISSILNAQYAVIDELVATLITTDNAVINNILKAGSIEVSGKITAESGKIGAFDISSEGLEAEFISDDSDVTEVKVTPNLLKYGELFKVYPSGDVVAKSFDLFTQGRIETSKVLIECYIRSTGTEYGQNWLSETIDGPSLTPNIKTIYKILTEGAFENKSYIWAEETLKFISIETENIISAYTREGVSDYSSDWLSLTEGGTPIIPDDSTIYKVISDNDFLDRTYFWDSINLKYIESGLNKIITQLKTSISPSGQLYADHIYFSDSKQIYIKQNDDSVIHQTIECNLRISDITIKLFDPDEVKLTFSRIIYDKNGIRQTGAQPFNNINLSGMLYVTYLYGDPVFVPFSQEIPMDSEASFIFTLSNSLFDWAHSITIYSFTPHTVFETDGVETSALSANIDILPEEYDDADGNTVMPKLGTGEHRWADIYLENAPDVLSDRRLKKEINYDISKYSKLFDALKPTSFKLKQKNEAIHLGFIAQDIEQSLIDCSLDIDSFACLVKTLKSKSNEQTKSDTDYTYGVRYSEMVALLVYEVQSLKKQVKELTKEVKKED